MRHWLCIIMLCVGAGAPGWVPAGAVGKKIPAGGQDQGAWARVRAMLPAPVLVLRPGWLPMRFYTAPRLQDVHDGRIAGTAYQVSYRDARGDVLLFALGPVNSARPDKIQRTRVRGMRGWLETSSGWPAIQVVWQVHTQHYAVQAHGVSHGEVLRIVASLTPV